MVAVEEEMEKELEIGEQVEGGATAKQRQKHGMGGGSWDLNE